MKLLEAMFLLGCIGLKELEKGKKKAAAQVRLEKEERKKRDERNSKKKMAV